MLHSQYGDPGLVLGQGLGLPWWLRQVRITSSAEDLVGRSPGEAVVAYPVFSPGESPCTEAWRAMVHGATKEWDHIERPA